MSSPIILCTPSHCAPHHAPHLIRLYIPSGSQTWEDPRDVLLTLVARSSTETPRRWARKRYVSTTWAGVLVDDLATKVEENIMRVFPRLASCRAVESDE